MQLTLAEPLINNASRNFAFGIDRVADFHKDIPESLVDHGTQKLLARETASNLIESGLESMEMPGKSNFASFSDKRIEIQNSSWGNWMRLIHALDKYACSSNIIFNVIGAFAMLTNIPPSLKQNIKKFVGLITNLSYVPYGISGMNQGIDKKNPFQAIGFLGEAVLPWFGNLKDIYLIRGISAGIDQIWEYADRNLPQKFAKGFFPDYLTGLKETSKACYKLFTEILQDPLKTIFPVRHDKTTNTWKFESKGHNGLLSTIFDVTASCGYMLTGKERLFGPMRDLASWLFDIELAFQDKLAKKASGMLFIIEGLLDFVARYLNTNQDMRLFVNMLAHASGRSALMLYKNSCASAQKIADSDK